jgi:hypothetical protein
MVFNLDISYRTMFNIEVFEAFFCLSVLVLSIIAIASPDASGSQGSLASRSNFDSSGFSRKPHATYLGGLIIFPTPWNPPNHGFPISTDTSTALTLVKYKTNLPDKFKKTCNEICHQADHGCLGSIMGGGTYSNGNLNNLNACLLPWDAVGTDTDITFQQFGSDLTKKLVTLTPKEMDQLNPRCDTNIDINYPCFSTGWRTGCLCTYNAMPRGYGESNDSKVA